MPVQRPFIPGVPGAAFPSTSNLVSAVLAGGFGLRLRAVVSDRPKVLAEIEGRPFIDILLEQLEAAGAKTAVLCIGYLGHQIKSRLGELQRGLNLLYSEENMPMGTGGALRLALPLFSSESVLVMNGDSYYNGDLTPLLTSHFKKKAAISVLLAKVRDTGRYGTVQVGSYGEIKDFREKDPAKSGPGWVNAGVYVIQKQVIQAIPEQVTISLEREVFPSLIGQGLHGYRGRGDFLDIGTPESYARAGAFIRSRP